MSLNSHLSQLERRHRDIEKQIETEKQHPSASDLRVVELKRKKLALKDQIEKLRAQSSGNTVH